jgi:hypothetical protein
MDDWIHRAKDKEKWPASVNAVINILPYKTGNILTIQAAAGFSRMTQLDIVIKPA